MHQRSNTASRTANSRFQPILFDGGKHQVSLRSVIEDQDTRAGKVFDGFILGVIGIALVCFAIETFPDLSPRMRVLLVWCERITVAIFTIEYVLRVAVATNRWKYIFSFWGIIDLLAILPFYLGELIDLRAIRVFRLLRLFRALKLMRYNRAIKRFHRAFIIAREEIVLFLAFACVLLFFAAVGIWQFEHDAQPETFTSLPHSLWWAVVTLTTVGYGDSYPVTAGGKIFTFLILMTGLGIVAVPAGLLASALVKSLQYCYYKRMRVFSSRPLEVVTVVAALLGASAVAADDWEMSAYKGWATATVAIEGVADRRLANDLQNGLVLSLSKGILGRNRPTFYPRVLAEDVQRVRLFLARRGYPYAEVTPRVSGNARRETVKVVLQVELGDAVTVGEIKINGLDDNLRNNTRGQFAVKKGGRFTDGDVIATKVAVIKQLRKLGYAQSKISSSTAWIDRTHVSVRFDVDPGAVYYFGDVLVEGADEDLVPLIRKTSQTRRGHRYETELVDDTHRGLRVLDLFRQVRLQLEPSAPDTIDVIITVVMRDPRTLETAISYFNDERLTVGARWTHRNIFKKGRGMSLEGRASIYLQQLRGSVWWPKIFIPRTRLVASLNAQRENEDAFESLSFGGSMWMRHSHSLQTISRVGVEIADITINQHGPNPDPDLQEGLTSVVFGTFDRSGGNDWINPTAGSVLGYRLRWAPGGILSDNKFLSNEITAIWYVPVRFRSTIALRGLVGVAKAYPESAELIATERFFSGGANSMRGFLRRRLGPKNLADAPIGGEVKIEAGIEGRFPLFWRVRGTLFIDTGQVWARVEDFEPKDIEVAVGPGLWLTTPVGPLRLDYAYRLTNFDAGEPRSTWHFSIGPAF